MKHHVTSIWYDFRIWTEERPAIDLKHRASRFERGLAKRGGVKDAHIDILGL